MLNDSAECDFDFEDEIARGAGGRSPYVPRSADPRDTGERSAAKDIRQQIQTNNFRIFSASLTDPVEKKANPLWGHYGESSQGVCLEINGDALMEALRIDLGRGPAVTPYHADEITYNDQCPKYPEPELTGAAWERRVKEAVFRKDTGWLFEREYRVVILTSEAELRAAPEKNISASLFTWRFPTGVVTKIHLGQHCSTATVATITGIAGGIPVQAHF